MRPSGQAKKAKCLLVLVLLTSAGCVRRDWVGDLLVLTEVSGSWAGTIQWRSDPNISLRLQQSGIIRTSYLEHLERYAESFCSGLGLPQE
jgi:hypothetical protein